MQDLNRFDIQWHGRHGHGIIWFTNCLSRLDSTGQVHTQLNTLVATSKVQGGFAYGNKSMEPYGAM